MMALPDGYRIADFSDHQRNAVIGLWEACGLTRPWNDPNKDIDRKLTDRNGAFWVILHRDAAGAETLVGSVMIGYDGHRGTINYLAVAEAHQSAGLGKAIMSACETFLEDLGCPKIHLMVRSENERVRAFYDRLGYDVETAVTFGKRIIPDN